MGSGGCTGSHRTPGFPAVTSAARSPREVGASAEDTPARDPGFSSLPSPTLIRMSRPPPLPSPRFQGEWTSGRACMVRGRGDGGVRGAPSTGSPGPKLSPHQGPGERPGWERQTLTGISGGAEPGEAAGRGAAGFSRRGGRLTPAWASPELVLWGQGPWAVGQDTHATAGTPTRVLGPLAGDGPQCPPLSNEANTLKTPGPPTPRSALAWGPAGSGVRGAL